MKRVPVYLFVATVVLAACGDDEPAGIEIVPPVISAVAPQEGTAGTELRVEGSGFQDGATVALGQLAPAPAEIETGVLFAAAPSTVQGGTTYDLIVTNPDGGADTLAAAFTAVAPTAARINGVTKPTGLTGMTLIIEGGAFGDDPAVSGGRVVFTTSTGTDLEAVIADPANDWTDEFVVTSVPANVTDTSWVWVETATGVSDSIEFRLIQSGQFSPSTINWTVTTPLPQALQGLGAAFVPVEDGPAPANYVFTLGGADTSHVATTAVYRATVEPSGALGASWATPLALPEPRAYHATAAATAFTAALDTATTSAYLYALGGMDADSSAAATVYVGHVDLDGEITAWSATEPLPVPLHSAGATIFRGFLYLTGGMASDGLPVATAYRAAINQDGTLEAWESLADLPQRMAYHSFLNFGPFLYTVGGDSAATPAVQATMSGTEIETVNLGRINLRTGDLTSEGWAPTTGFGKTRSKHSTVYAGGALFATSGVYSGNPGSSENTAGAVAADGTIASWGGATGSETIATELGYSLYNQAAVTFIDTNGTGHVLVLGGANRQVEGDPSAAVLFY